MKNSTHIIARYVVTGLLILMFSGLICYRLVDTTVVHRDEWNALAMKELTRVTPIRPTRGRLLAADGRVLAANRRLYTIRVDFTSEQFRFEDYRKALPALADSMAAHFKQRDSKHWLERLHEPLNLSQQKGVNPDIDKKLDAELRSWPLLLKVESADVELIKSFPFFSKGNPAKTGLTVEPVDDRIKPFGSLASRSIGIVAEDTASTDRRGRSGLEGALDSLLYGVPGVAKKVPLTKYIGDWVDVPPVPGYDITTTIDIDIQDIVENELMGMLKINRADWGSAILMEVKTGNIRAISNFEYNPKTGLYDVCINRIFAPYEPGSVMKPVSMLIALEDGIVKSVDQTFPGHGGNWPFPNAKRPIQDSHPMGAVPVRLIIPYSSNIATAEMIMSRWRNNPAGFPERLATIGFNELLNVGVKGEKLPVIDTVPSVVDLSRMAYGYTTAIPPIYTLSVYNAIANGGRMVRPRLYTRLERADTVIDLEETYIRDRICSEEHAAMLRKMLRDVVDEPGATAYKVLHGCTVPLAGKTGTCYKVENRNYNKSKKRVAFCGFFPADNPIYSCFVFMEWPKVQYVGAASASGQVMKGIALKLHARGLLNNSSDFTLETHPGTRPALDALPAGSPGYAPLASALALDGATAAPTPAPTGAGAVPDVTGMSLRQAVAVMEDAGFNVSVRGTGFVTAQRPAAGADSIPAGSTVTLTLDTQLPDNPNTKPK